MKKTYVTPEVEYINFYSEETITSDSWTSTEEEGLEGTMSVVGKDSFWS